MASDILYHQFKINVVNVFDTQVRFVYIYERHLEKTWFYICKNKEADQCLCFRFRDSTIPDLPESKLSSF